MRRMTLSPRGLRAQGFSLIEVLIALLILGIGLLGLALLQTMGLRFTQSSNYRTVATNLAYEMLDSVRATHRLRGLYADAGLTGWTGTGACQVAGTMGPETSRDQWRCRVSRALPNGRSQVTVVGNHATVRIAWTDARWEEAENRQITEFVLEATL
ncbi:type IV pilus modification protein PilV [Coralloluteibacterium thermophilus]|uniref:Type IV pilus modification protein PilV n=1 Tax=Coralloluteibacterium thermophilum TaxID=2707049 RepID=A0ABV9NLG4_9GAMM